MIVAGNDVVAFGAGAGASWVVVGGLALPVGSVAHLGAALGPVFGESLAAR